MHFDTLFDKLPDAGDTTNSHTHSEQKTHLAGKGRKKRYRRLAGNRIIKAKLDGKLVSLTHKFNAKRQRKAANEARIN